LNEPAGPLSPTAQTIAAPGLVATAPTPSVLAGLGLVTTLHAVPFQFSVRVCESVLQAGVKDPAAHTLFAAFGCTTTALITRRAQTAAATYRRYMDVQTHEDVAATAAARTELGHEYDSALAEGLIERISSEIDKQVDARLAQRGIRPVQPIWAGVALGLGSVGLGIGATAVTLHSLATTGTVPKAVVDLGPLHASVMTGTTSISTTQVVLVVLIWVVVAVVNIAYARRRPGHP